MKTRDSTAIKAKYEKGSYSPARKGLKGRAERRVERIRELAAALLEQADSLDSKQDASESVETASSTAKVAFFEEVRRFEIRLIKRALELAGGNHAGAAKILGLGVSTFKYKVKAYADSEEFRRSERSIRELGFAGMWADREDIKDGVSYVNRLRDSPRA